MNLMLWRSERSQTANRKAQIIRDNYSRTSHHLLSLVSQLRSPLEVYLMKYRIIAVIALIMMVLNLGGSTFADSNRKKPAASELVALLPASDAVVTIDVRRFLGEAMPRLLAANQPMLTKLNSAIEKVQSKAGIDVRKFEYLAAGVSLAKTGVKNIDHEPVVIARGQISSASLIGAAKLAANGKYTEERVGEKTIYVFAGNHIRAQNPTAKVPDVIAVTVLDTNTIAFGTLPRVRETVQARSRVTSDLSVMVERTPGAVMSFAAKVPAGMKTFLPLENDELGRNIDSIQYVYGNADVAAESASLHLIARTLQSAQAKSLYETLEGLQMFGKAFLGSAKTPDKQVFSRLIDNAKFSVRGNEVSLDLVVPQSDIDILVGKLK